MKRNFLLISFLFLTSITFAQTEQGQFMLGGQFNFGGGSRHFSSHLNPDFGYFIQDNWAIGAGIGLHYSRDIRTNSVDRISLGYQTKLFTRYYFAPEKKWRPFLHAEAGFSQSHYRLVK